jgi:hypothetical protein
VRVGKDSVAFCLSCSSWISPFLILVLGLCSPPLGLIDLLSVLAASVRRSEAARDLCVGD